MAETEETRTEVVYRPDEPHRCGPNRNGVWPGVWHEPAGTVRQCVCGKAWVAYRDEADAGYMGVKWRREGWLAGWRRRRG